MKINVAKSAIQNLVDLINSTNSATSLNLTTSQVTFGNPAARTPDADPSNTSVSVSPVNGQGIGAGDITITYTRLALNQGVTGGASGSTLDFTVEGNDATASASLLATVADHLGLVPGQFQIDSSTPLSGVTQGGGAVGILLTPVANSLLYAGNVTIQVEWPAATPTLDSLVVNKQQSGFEAA